MFRGKVCGIPTFIDENGTPMVADKSRVVVVTINADNGIFYYHHVTTSEISGVMCCSGVYKPGSWIYKITGDIINMHADVLDGYVNGDSADARLEVFLTFPNALVHPQSKKVR